MVFEKKYIPQKEEDISRWYNSVILKAELADYGPVKGTMIFRPYGYRVWELVQQEMDKLIKEHRIENAYFPLFIPESFLKKEKEHVEGFAPELAVVTMGGGKELEDKLVVRPTSETIMYDAYSKWVHSWRDLPVLINQWGNVVRWEKRTYLFLRTSEFLWQEGHTAHTTHEEALEMVLWAMKMYEKTYVEYFALPGIIGKKSQAEKFAGALSSLSYESLMPDGKALQSCTSHDLGQNFAKPFDIKFQDRDGKEKYVWQTSWGLSTRSLGGLILAHGDSAGLKIPPKLAPVQVIIIPVKLEEKTISKCNELKLNLERDGIRVKVDLDETETMGFKINKWELKGVPVRIEVGPKEVETNSLTLVSRNTGEKEKIDFNGAEEKINKILEKIQKSMYEEALKFSDKNTYDVGSDYKKFKKTMQESRGFIHAFWCENPECEAKIKEETKATTRCLPLDAKEENGKCIYCGKESKHKWLFAQAY